MLKEHLTVVVEEAVDEGARLVNASDADIAAVAVGEHELALEQGREEIPPCVTAVLVFAYQLERVVGICLFVVADTEEVNAALFAVELEVYRGDRLVKTGGVQLFGTVGEGVALAARRVDDVAEDYSRLRVVL